MKHAQQLSVSGLENGFEKNLGFLVFKKNLNNFESPDIKFFLGFIIFEQFFHRLYI